MKTIRRSVFFLFVLITFLAGAHADGIPATVDDLVPGDRFITRQTISFSANEIYPNDRFNNVTRLGRLAFVGPCFQWDFYACSRDISLHRMEFGNFPAATLLAGTVLTVHRTIPWFRDIYDPRTSEDRGTTQYASKRIELVSPNGTIFSMAFATLSPEDGLPAPLMKITEMKTLLKSWFTFQPIPRPNL